MCGSLWWGGGCRVGVGISRSARAIREESVGEECGNERRGEVLIERSDETTLNANSYANLSPT